MIWGNLDKEIKISRCFDVAVIFKILHDPVIFKDITEDGASDCNWPDVVNDIYIVPSVGSSPLGCFMLRRIRKHTYDVHINILPEFRKKYALESTHLFYDWILKNIPALKKMTANIPEKYKTVFNFAKKVGFKREGIVESCYLKDGELISEYIVGIDINKMAEVLKWQF